MTSIDELLTRLRDTATCDAAATELYARASEAVGPLLDAMKDLAEDTGVREARAPVSFGGEAGEWRPRGEVRPRRRPGMSGAGAGAGGAVALRARGRQRSRSWRGGCWSGTHGPSQDERSTVEVSDGYRRPSVCGRKHRCRMGDHPRGGAFVDADVGRPGAAQWLPKRAMCTALPLRGSVWRFCGTCRIGCSCPGQAGDGSQVSPRTSGQPVGSDEREVLASRARR